MVVDLNVRSIIESVDEFIVFMFDFLIVLRDCFVSQVSFRIINIYLRTDGRSIGAIALEVPNSFLESLDPFLVLRNLLILFFYLLI